MIFGLDHHLMDPVPGWLIFVATVILFLIVDEIGFRLARRLNRGDDEDRKSHAGLLLGALLALLGLLLAFSFSMVDARFQARKALVLEEANAIGTTYLRAEMLPAPHSARIEGLLREYVSTRVGVETQRELERALAEAEKLHRQLWNEAERVAEAYPNPIVALFVSSLNEMIDLHEERVTVSLYQRFPGAILTTLYLVAILSMGVLGYTTGLSRRRSFLPAFAVLVAISLVMVLVIEMDRPWQRLIQVSQQSLVDVQEIIERQVRAELPR